MTQERIMFSNPTPSEPRLSPAATISDDMMSALTPHLILQPASPPQVVVFEYSFLALSEIFNHSDTCGSLMNFVPVYSTISQEIVVSD